jgi:hypothetical protein
MRLHRDDVVAVHRLLKVAIVLGPVHDALPVARITLPACKLAFNNRSCSATVTNCAAKGCGS